ncbi:MAG: glycosyltransferase family 4 protein [Candidatus Limnocylindrales bacterium]
MTTTDPDEPVPDRAGVPDAVGEPATPGEPIGPGHATRLMLVTSLYPTPDRPEVGAFVARRVAALRARGVRVDVVASPDYRRGALLRHIALLVAALTARGPFDGVEGHVLFPAGLVALLAARFRRVPLVVYAHGADAAVRARRSAFHHALACLVARGSAAVVTNSADTAAHVRALGVEARVIPPGVDLTRFHPISPQERGSLRASNGLDPDARLAVYLGSLSRRKGADVFAAAVLAAAGWQGVLVGRGELATELVTRYPAVRQVGPVAPDEVPAWLQAADVVVVPSRREPLGLAAVEALACGVPVVASAVGGLREIICDAEAGLLVPPGDPAALTAALDRLADRALRSRRAAAARASVTRQDLERRRLAMAQLWRSLGVAA